MHLPMLEQRTKRLLAAPAALKMMFVFCTPFLPNTISQQTQTYIKRTDLNHPKPTHTWHFVEFNESERLQVTNRPLS